MQRWSNLFIPTLREAPADATSASHIYLLRSGYARRIGGGYSYLPLGCLALEGIAAVVRMEFRGYGQQLQLAQNGGRPFHERAMPVAGAELRSYKQLPTLWYQIGPARVEACSFGLSPAVEELTVLEDLQRMLRICEVNFAPAADGPGENDTAFVTFADRGDEPVLSCKACSYAATALGATSQIKPVIDLEVEGVGGPLEVKTPGQRTIDDVARFLSISAEHTAKTLTYFAGEKRSERPVVALLRGDHKLDEGKLGRALKCGFRPMEPAEAQALFRAPFGSLGPVGIPKDAKPLILVDTALRGRKNLVTGANREDYHFWDVTPERDFVVDRWVDLRVVEAGEPCPKCGAPLQGKRAVRLASAATVDSALTVLDKNGKDDPVHTAHYSIDLENILTTAIEQHHDDQGFWLSPSIAPFTVLICVMSVRDEELMKVAEKLGKDLESAGYSVLLDDRDERPGVKFKDADLSGIPYRVTVGKKVSEGKVEVFHRSTRTTHDASIAAIKDALRPA